MDNYTAIQILESIKSGHELNLYVKNRIQQGELSFSDIKLLETIIELLSIVEKFVDQVSTPNRVKQISANILFYIDELIRNANEDNLDLFLYDFRFHYSSLYRILELEVAYIVENYVNKIDYPLFYPETQTVDHNAIIQKGEEAPFKVSVVLLAYNNLKYTRDCVESILRNTNDVEYELILVDNGSTDGTKEYFDSIAGAKVIHLKYNIHLVKGFNVGIMAAEGRYCAAVCNDFIFTPNWLNNLITCIESDPKIGFVSPGATSISNMQKINIPFNSIEDFEEKAGEFNVSDPSKWEERVVLLPNVLCCPTALLEQIGYYDTRFYRGEFLDDDISFKIRRAGYKLVYCADTVTHHYGSLTTASDHQTNSLEEGRQTFIEKYGLDAWDDARMNLIYLKLDYSNLRSVRSVLGIDVRCGATVLQIRNRLWSHHGIKPEFITCSSDEKYELDLHTISNEVISIESLYDIPKRIKEKVDLIYIEKPLDCYIENIDNLFSSLSEVLTDEGQLVFMVNNFISIDSIIDMLNSKQSLHNRKILIQDMILSQAAALGFRPNLALNITSDHNSMDNTVVAGLAEHLSQGNQDIKRYLETVFRSKFTLYQMSYKSIPITQ